MVKFNQQVESGERYNINMMPLIDILFNLLIFFLITASISSRGINLELPEAISSEKIPAKSWEIVINAKEQLFLNDTRIDPNKFEKILTGERMRPQTKRVETIILKAHKSVPFGSFISIMDTARNTGFHNLIIATDKKRTAHRFGKK